VSPHQGVVQMVVLGVADYGLVGTVISPEMILAL
jgi:hypothetical protein